MRYSLILSNYSLFAILLLKFNPGDGYSGRSSGGEKATVVKL